MGASSSGLLDETKINQIKGLVESSLQRFSTFYHQQYDVAYFAHLHQEVEPKKEGRGLLLTRRPHYAPEEALYQSSVKFSCWDEPGKKCRERYAILRRDHSVEIHDNMEAFSRGGAAKFVLQPAGASVFTTEEESRAHLEKTCAGILNGVKEDSSSVVSSPDAFAVFLHLLYRGHTCFLFQHAEERDRFLSALQTCIRHRNLDPWCGRSYERRAFARALRLYRQDKGCYKSWEMLLGTEEQVLASQVMEEVLPWLQTMLQPRVKGKKSERIRQWLATVQATYALVLEQLTASLDALREECRRAASANQALVRSNLDQIVSSRRFLEQKVRDCVCEGAERACSQQVAPYIPSILQVLTEHVGAGVAAMQGALQARMDSSTQGGAQELKEALSSISLDHSYQQVEKLTEKLEDLKQRFGLNSTQRLLHSAHLEMEQLLDSAVYTFEQYLQSSARLQLSQADVKMKRAKERVLKQLDYDSRVVQRRLYEEALLEITLPCLTRQMDNKWKTELQQFEQYIFSDYSRFILVHNVYDDILRNILSEEIVKAVQDAAGKTSTNLLLDASDLALSQYSLLGGTPPRSTPGSPALHARGASEAELDAEAKPQENPEQSAAPLPAAPVETQQSDDAKNRELVIEQESDEVQIRAEEPIADPPVITDRPDPSPADVQAGSDQPESPGRCVSPEENPEAPPPEVPAAQQLDGSESTPVTHIEQSSEGTQIRTDGPAAPPEADVADDGGTSDPPADLEAAVTDCPEQPGELKLQEASASSSTVVLMAESDGYQNLTAVSIKTTTEEVHMDAGEPPAAVTTPDPSSEVEVQSLDSPDASPPVSQQSADVQAGCDQFGNREAANSPDASTPHVETGRTCSAAPDPASAISLGSLSDAIGSDAAETPAAAQQRTDRAVYLTGEIKNNWLMEQLNKEKEAAERSDVKREEEQLEDGGHAQTESEALDEGCRSSGSPAEGAAAQKESEGREETTGGEDGEEVEEDGAPEPPLDSVAAIRDLVMEVTEVETLISPRPGGQTERDGTSS